MIVGRCPGLLVQPGSVQWRRSQKSLNVGHRDQPLRCHRPLSNTYSSHGPPRTEMRSKPAAHAPWGQVSWVFNGVYRATTATQRASTEALRPPRTTTRSTCPTKSHAAGCRLGAGVLSVASPCSIRQASTVPPWSPKGAHQGCAGREAGPSTASLTGHQWGAPEKALAARTRKG